jgi:hypothetical protein
MIELNFEEQIKNKLEVNSNRKNITCNATPNSTGHFRLSSIYVLSTVRRDTKLSRIFVFKVPLEFDWKWA